MSIRLLSVNFGKLSGIGFLVRVSAIKDGMKNNRFYPDPWPDWIPSRAQFIGAIEDYLHKSSVAENGGKGEIASRDAARESLTAMLQKVASYLEEIANGNVEMLESTGYAMRRQRTMRPPGPLPAPEKVVLRHGPLSGMLLLGSAKVKGAGAYESQLGLNPEDESSWTLRKVTSICRRVEFTGLTPGVVYFGRIRAIGSKGPGAWSDIAQLRAL